MKNLNDIGTMRLTMSHAHENVNTANSAIHFAWKAARNSEEDSHSRHGTLTDYSLLGTFHNNFRWTVKFSFYLLIFVCWSSTYSPRPRKQVTTTGILYRSVVTTHVYVAHTDTSAIPSASVRHKRFAYFQHPDI